MLNDVMVKVLVSVTSGLIMGTCGTIIAYLKNRVRVYKKAEQEQNITLAEMRLAMIDILHDRLFVMMHEYLAQGFIYQDEAERATREVERMYHAYKTFGGNGTGTEAYERFKKLPWKNREPGLDEPTLCN